MIDIWSMTNNCWSIGRFHLKISFCKAMLTSITPFNPYEAKAPDGITPHVFTPDADSNEDHSNCYSQFTLAVLKIIRLPKQNRPPYIYTTKEAPCSAERKNSSLQSIVVLENCSMIHTLRRHRINLQIWTPHKILQPIYTILFFIIYFIYYLYN